MVAETPWHVVEAILFAVSVHALYDSPPRSARVVTDAGSCFLNTHLLGCFPIF